MEECEALIALAGVQDESQRALSSAENALVIAADSGFTLLEGVALTVLAELHLARDERKLASEYAQRALEIHRSTGHVSGESRAMRGYSAKVTFDGRNAVVCHSKTSPSRGVHPFTIELRMLYGV
ncbi:hypothetical protein [Fodinicola feengrottensis]|uniref:hypothetical protein n=1 Tax=Fodinicola feengrottensis TaxID=435914 RepID=UPI0013CF8443|nr:hypothetical protein [Fodinicola feengrottensis]